MDDHAHAKLIARLLAERAIPRDDREAQRVLTDESFRLEVERRLAESGLRLLDNPFAAHIAVGLSDAAEQSVFGSGDQWLTNNLGLQRDGVALLVLLWALIVLPKRERQILRQAESAEGQGDMFAAAKPLAATDASRGVPESVLREDYGKQLGGWTRININLGVLSRTGFIERRKNVIYEGPLLDLAFDYGDLAPRIIEGALGELLAKRRAAAEATQASSPVEGQD